MHRAAHSAEVAASAAVCFDALTDFESFPAWQSAVERAEVLERADDGLGELIRFEVDAKVKRVAYTVRYGYERSPEPATRPWRISWEFVDGNGVSDIDGDYTLEPLGDSSRTRATYRLGIDPGVPVPGLVARRLMRELMRRSVNDLRAEAERRAR